jgi:hypothetical protein
MKPKKTTAAKNGKISVDALVAKAETATKLAKAAKNHMKLLKLEHRQARKAFKQARKAAKQARKQAEEAIQASKAHVKITKPRTPRNRNVKAKRPQVQSASAIEALPLATMSQVTNGVRPAV